MTLTEKHFRRYEPVIAAWLNAHPSTYTFTPKDVQANTASGELRRAIRIQLRHGFTSPISVTHLAKAWAAVQVSHTETEVRIGLPERVAKLIEVDTPERPSGVERIILTTPTQRDLECFLHLLNTNHLKLEVEVHLCDPQISAWFESAHLAYFNVSLLNWSPANFSFC